MREYVGICLPVSRSGGGNEGRLQHRGSVRETLGHKLMRIFEFTGIPLHPGDERNVMPQYSWEDLRPYTPTPEQEAKYAQSLRPYRMFPERNLDERFADFKVRLAAAIERRKLGH
jgi:hypothetical protein